MSALLRLLFAAVLIGCFVTGVFAVIAALLNQIVFNPESRAWKALLAKLRNRLNMAKASPGMLPEFLLPYDSDVLAQLSLKPKMLKKAGWRENIFEGVFTTIYQEPVLQFAGQKNGNTAVVLARTGDREYIFRQKGKELELWVDAVPYAVLVQGKLISSGKQSRLLAQLEMDPELRQWPVILGASDAAAMTNGNKAISPVPRALTLLRKLDPEEEQTLLLLAVIQGLEL